MYYIVNWDTTETLYEFDKLSIAKRRCRGLGHTGEGNGVWFNPVARVVDENGYCVYNPKFRVAIGAAVGSLVGTFDNHLR